MLVAMPTLNNLDDVPSFPRDRRLASAFAAGGLAAERGERAAIKAEEDAVREAHREAFVKMVADARAAAAQPPPPPHDPMRFRAVPPGVRFMRFVMTELVCAVRFLAFDQLAHDVCR